MGGDSVDIGIAFKFVKFIFTYLYLIFDFVVIGTFRYIIESIKLFKNNGTKNDKIDTYTATVIHTGLAISLVILIIMFTVDYGYFATFVAFVMISFAIHLIRKARSDDSDLIRGTSVNTKTNVDNKNEDNKKLMVGDLTIDRSVEVTHFLIAGTTGTGKSQIINNFLKTIRERGDKVLCVDSGGEAMARLFRDGDILLNPLDARSVNWSPYAEMSNAYDSDRMSQMMVPASDSGSEREWQLFSQALIAAILQRSFESGTATNEELVRLLTIADADELAKLVTGLSAVTLFEKGAAKMLSSVRGIVGSYLPSYRFLKADTGNDGFSIRKWVTSEEKSWLWVPYRDDQLSSIKSLISCWLGEAVNASLSLRPSQTRRMWIICDELASLGKIASLADGLTKGRKYGLVVVAGLQSISQLRAVFGQHEAQTLLSCLASTVCLRAADGETAKYFSESFGKQEILREEESDQKYQTGGTTSMKHVTQDAVMSSELSGLKNLTGYARLADDPGTLHLVKIPICDLGEERIAPFVNK
jgi:type IV secretory pathway TraG/TraD family ATPase VirD4